MMIKKITQFVGISIFLFFCLNELQSQNMNLKVDNRLKDVFTQQKIDRLEAEGSFKIAVYNYFLDHSYYLSERAPEEAQNMGNISQLGLVKGSGYFRNDLSVFENNTFNPYLYELNIPYDTAIYYVIDEGKKYLVFYSREQYETNLTQYLNNQKIIIE